MLGKIGGRRRKGQQRMRWLDAIIDWMDMGLSGLWVLVKTLECTLDCEEILPVHPKGDETWVFIVRTDVEAETPILWPPDVKS